MTKRNTAIFLLLLLVIIFANSRNNFSTVSSHFLATPKNSIAKFTPCTLSLHHQHRSSHPEVS